MLMVVLFVLAVLWLVGNEQFLKPAGMPNWDMCTTQYPVSDTSSGLEPEYLNITC